MMLNETIKRDSQTAFFFACANKLPAAVGRLNSPLSEQTWRIT